MTDDQQSGSGSLASRFVRSIAHRPAGDPPVLPIEGALAPFDGATGWLNSEPLTPAGLRGRVVLVDFWTYTCVNWLRTLPYLRAWAARYGEQDLAIVGVHTPEFGFEHQRENVERQATDFGVTYPIALDNGYRVWTAFANHFWPAVYLADAEGRIRYHHFGEGEYAMTEMAIQQLLAESGRRVEPDLVDVHPTGLEVAADWATLRSPETYLGYDQARGFASPEDLLEDAVRDYAEPGGLALNHWAPVGSWSITAKAAVLAGSSGRLAFRFQARDVNLVMGPARSGTGVEFRVLLDGEPAIADHGTDTNTRATGVVTEQRTYQLVRQRGPIAERTVEIEFLGEGVEAFCFTFG
jgi:thiol-disulfide isomerase/thioredoxin